jgi:hypothetical protein
MSIGAVTVGLVATSTYSGPPSQVMSVKSNNTNTAPEPSTTAVSSIKTTAPMATAPNPPLSTQHSTTAHPAATVAPTPSTPVSRRYSTTTDSTATVPSTTHATETPYPPCGEANWGSRLTTNQTVYSVGQPVVITNSYLNPESTCTPSQQTTCPPLSQVSTENSQGVIVWNYEPVGVPIPCNQAVPYPIPHGVWVSATATWNPQVPPGTYRVFGNEPEPIIITIVATPPSTT